MFGGLKKSASRLALVAAAGVLSTGAMAADLGGDCCADLEERVAELEATTARKGNRRMSLQVYGWVNKTIMHWTAPTVTTASPAAGGAPVGAKNSGTYLGIDNTNAGTRFGFRGDAKVSPSVKAGYSILLDISSGARSATVTRSNEDAAADNGGADHTIRMRDANLWLESSSVGRLTLGRLTGSGAVGLIDLGGIGNVAPATILSGNGIAFANGVSTAQYMDGGADYGVRKDGLRYDSPVFAGFTVSASIGETLTASPVASAVHGRVYGVSLRYAGEFSGVRVAAGVGYERVQDETVGSPAGANAQGTHLGGALSLVHTPTGLFLQGNYLKMEREYVAGVELEGKSYNIQAGIGQNWFGLGKTSLYGEYGKYTNDAALFRSANFNSTAAESQLTMWGLGVTQDIDAAAMQLYAGYRNLSAKETGAAPGNIGLFMAGARVNF